MGNENIGTVHALTAAARRNTSLREGGGLGRSPKTEGASGRTAHLTARDGTSPVVLITPITYHPPSKPELHRPLAPSVTANAVPAPSRRELCGVPPQSISHDSFQQIVTSLTRPVSLPSRRLPQIPPSGREVAWGAAPRRREPAGAQPI